jgi:hypothetical protein
MQNLDQHIENEDAESVTIESENVRQAGIEKLAAQYRSERYDIEDAEERDLLVDFIAFFRTGKLTARLAKAEAKLDRWGSSMLLSVNGVKFTLKVDYDTENFGGNCTDLATKAYDAGVRA